ncbi:MAG: hypothetical protein RIS20_1524 [Bacteroidota bacterium]|jgi:hypothetical protein
MRLLSCMLFIGILFSCSTANKDKQLKQIDALITQLDSLSNVYEVNRFDSLNYWRQEASNIELAIKNNYYATKVEPVLSRKMNRFKSLQEIIDAESELGGEGEYEEEEKEMTLGLRMMLLNRGFKKEKIALGNLKSDMESNAIDDSEITGFIEQESLNVTRLNNALTQYLFVKNTELKEYIRLCNDLRLFADSIQRKN